MLLKLLKDFCVLIALEIRALHERVTSKFFELWEDYVGFESWALEYFKNVD